jgi:FkbM family methyltransferase
VIDVGANSGQYAGGLRAAGYRGRIVSFEPLSEPYGQLAAASSKDADWDCRQLALGRRPGTTTINVSEDSRNFADHVASRRRGGGDDLLADVVAAERRGQLADDEIPGLCILLYVAGTETVADFIGNALAALAERADQRAVLAANPALGPAAVEELLRFESPVQYQVRTATAVTELHGVTIPAGGAVALLWGAANRDERRWERPDELDLTRAAQRNLAFGEGIHHCLGAPLAHLQGRVVLEETLRAMPGYRLAGELERIATHNTRGVARLPIVPA